MGSVSLRVPFKRIINRKPVKEIFDMTVAIFPIVLSMINDPVKF